MRNFNVSRMRLLGALACWPPALAACSVYDDVIETTASTAGSAGLSGKGGVSGGGGSDAGRGGSTEQHAGETAGGAGSSSAGTPSQSGSDSGGSAGSSAGSGGTAAGSSAGGSDAGGQPPLADVVDDMEDADQQIAVDGGRNGFWYVGHDLTTGTQTPATAKFSMPELSVARGDSMYAAYMKASDFSDWGSVIGLNLVEQPALASYDASSYCAVEFWGKAAGATSLRLRLPDADTHPEGGVCSTSGAANTLCYDHFSAPVALTASWKSYSIAFASLQQIGTGYHPADKKFKADKLYGLEWALPGVAGKTYEIWIDDVTFVPCP
jgi:hypothetical protein